MQPTVNRTTAGNDTTKEWTHTQVKFPITSVETISPTLPPAINQEQTDRANGQTRHITSFAPDEGRYVSIDEYWNNWYEHPYLHIDANYEWCNGILETKPVPAQPQRQLYKWFFGIMDSFINTYPIADLIYLETGFRLSMADREQPTRLREAVRKPDIGVVRKDNPMPLKPHERSYRGVCDMCVEAVSDSTPAEVRRDTVEKMRDYALAGVQEYFILDPDDRFMHFYRLTADRHYEEIQADAQGVVRSQVLPGFQFRRSDLKRQRAMEVLALDEVYAGYVLLEYQAEVAARRKAEEQIQALQAEVARLRNLLS